MAKVKIQGNAAGSGVFTVTAPTSNTDRTLTLPDTTGTLLDENSSVPAANLTGTVAAVSGVNLTALNATNLGSGTVPTARLGSGTASSSTILYGDQTYKAAPTSFNPDAAVTINDTGADVDFRVESDTDANALFVQGSDSKVGINTATPNAVLHIGDSSAEGSQTNPALQIGRSAGSVDSYRLGFYTTSEGGHIENKNGDDGLNFKVKTSGQVLQLTTDGRGLSQFTAKAWINFNGTGTIAIRDSHNVSSITDNGTGDYTVTFSNAMANANYAVSTNGNQELDPSTHSDTIGKIPGVNNQVAANFELMCGFFASVVAVRDFELVQATVFGD